MGFVFDMGNVLSLDVDVLPCMAARLGMTIERITDYAGDDFGDLLVGAKTAEEFWRDFNRHFGTDVREDLLITCFHPATDPRMERLILDLKAAGHRVVCGTNAFEKHYRYHLERGEYAVFDRVYASNLMGIAKPSPDFFQHILDAGGLAGRRYVLHRRPGRERRRGARARHAGIPVRLRVALRARRPPRLARRSAPEPHGRVSGQLGVHELDVQAREALQSLLQRHRRVLRSDERRRVAHEVVASRPRRSPRSSASAGTGRSSPRS